MELNVSKHPTTNGGRLIEFDFIKGFVMLLITWGHVTNALFAAEITFYFPAKLITATFAMPIYMWISGYLSSTRIQITNPIMYLTYRFKRILIPCLLWNTISWLVVCMLKIIFHRGSLEGPDFLGIWFLWSLFICDALMVLQVKLLKKNNLIICSSVLLSFILMLLPTDI